MEMSLQELLDSEAENLQDVALDHARTFDREETFECLEEYYSEEMQDQVIYPFLDELGEKVNKLIEEEVAKFMGPGGQSDRSRVVRFTPEKPMSEMSYLELLRLKRDHGAELTVEQWRELSTLQSQKHWDWVELRESKWVEHYQEAITAIVDEIYLQGELKDKRRIFAEIEDCDLFTQEQKDLIHDWRNLENPFHKLLDRIDEYITDAAKWFLQELMGFKVYQRHPDEEEFWAETYKDEAWYKELYGDQTKTDQEEEEQESSED